MQACRVAAAGAKRLRLATDLSQRPHDPAIGLALYPDQRPHHVVASWQTGDWHRTRSDETRGIAGRFQRQSRGYERRPVERFGNLNERPDGLARAAPDDIKVGDGDGLNGKLQPRLKRVVAPQTKNERAQF